MYICLHGSFTSTYRFSYRSLFL